MGGVPLRAMACLRRHSSSCLSLSLCLLSTLILSMIHVLSPRAERHGSSLPRAEVVRSQQESFSPPVIVPWARHRGKQSAAEPERLPPAQPSYLLSSVYAKDGEELLPTVRFTPDTPRSRHSVGALKGSPEFPRLRTGGKTQS